MNNSNTKTSTSNNGNYKNNIVINKIKIIKSNENDTDKQNNEHFFFKKKYYINRNNYNKDIYNLIYTDNFNYFFSKVYSTPKNNILIKPLNLDEHEKNEINWFYYSVLIIENIFQIINLFYIMKHYIYKFLFYIIPFIILLYYFQFIY